MTREEKRELLASYRMINAEVNGLMAVRDECFAAATRITPGYGHSVRGGGDGDRLGRSVARLIELENQIDERVDLLADTGKRLLDAINRIERAPLRAVLLLKYIDGKTFSDIGERLGYSTRQTQNLHDRAIDEIRL